MLRFATIFAVGLGGYPAAAAEIAGPARVLDGDTLEVGATKIRIHGIDAPEKDQVCLDAKAKRWTCGIEARDRLEHRLAGKPVVCTSVDTDRYGRTVARCLQGTKDVGRWMVRQGWALAYRQYSRAYEGDETAAKDARAGMWAGAFIAGWDWRLRNKSTVILGSVSVPKDAQDALLGRAAAVDAPDPACGIKGNINRSGECIYHRPGQRHYDKVRMSGAKGKRWFCSPSEAEAAGCRAAKI